MKKEVDNIEKKLELLLNEMEYNSYKSFIKQNIRLRIYDNVLGRIDIDYYPKFYRLLLTKKFLRKIEKIIDNKIEELDLN